ncbi:cell division protein ZapB [Salinicola sp. LHM]|uniref:cell division protein ZapB n=1 Tax=Salinicola TaxID=404432 RepID=UPI0008DDB26A|nr:MULTISPECIES: cell division protein ZapB [Salinicola]MDF3920451.1 cell division protein ZapB [Salinicola salarius]OHZ01248.1 cell division protein ZapB [Salinicola sp. MIT1003]WQH33870.1 cell division protein ZapB [Salinicola sp. LHM]
MNGEIFAKLEQKIQDAVDSIEMLKMENEELKAENARFQQEREEWEQRLGGLLDKLQSLDSTGDSTNQNG